MSERARPPRRVGNSKSDELVFMALGGLGEIGMNVYLYGYGPANARSWLMVDLGVTFPNDSEPGADVVLPDLRFIIADRKNLVGLVLTHAHEDHIGAVIDLWPSLECPIFATPFTAGMVKTKLGEYGRTQSLPIREVMRQAGCTDKSHFSKDFRARFGVGARQYRAAFRSEPRPLIAVSE